jgi:hypothetical protein
MYFIGSEIFKAENMKSEIVVITQSCSYVDHRVKILFLTDSELSRRIWMNFAKRKRRKLKFR